MDVDPVRLIEQRCGIQLKRVSGHEWSGPCPHCGGDDRWHFWDDKLNWWCRPGPGHCGQKGFLDDLFDELKQPSWEQKVEWRLRQLEAAKREHERRLSNLEQMHQCKDYLRYHQNLTMEALEYWWGEGMTNETIDRYRLGYCKRCPTDRDGRASYTIPVIIHDKLYNIRHRLIGGENGDKYRPHMAGLPNVLFNADNLYRDDIEKICICEGEKKSLVVEQHGFPNVGIMGKSGFNPSWVTRFDRFKTVYVALDPDAIDGARRLAGMFGGRGRVVVLPCKIDDMIVRYSATANDIEWFLRVAEPVRNGHAKSH